MRPTRARRCSTRSSSHQPAARLRRRSDRRLVPLTTAARAPRPGPPPVWRFATIRVGIGERWAIVSAVAYTVVNVTLRVAAPTIDPYLGSFVRLVPLAILAWAIVLRGGATELRPRAPAFLTWRLIGYLVAGGAVSLVLGNVLFFGGLTNGGLGITIGGVQAGSVLGGLWIGLLVNHDRPTAGQLAGAGLLVAGLVGVAIAQTSSVAELWWLGLVFALGAGTTYALANAFTRIVQRERPLLFVTLAISNLGGAVPLALIIGVRAAVGETIGVDTASVAAVLLAGCANAVALLSLTLAVRAAPIATVNTISSASIIFSFVASVTIFGEVGTPPMVVGIALVTAGIVVAQLRRRAAAATPGEPPVEPATPPAAT